MLELYIQSCFTNSQKGWYPQKQASPDHGVPSQCSLLEVHLRFHLMKLHQKPFHQSLIHQLLCQESQSLPEPTWELWQMLRPRTPGLSCGSPPPTEAGKRNPDPCPHVLPFTPDKQGLKVPLRDLGEKALTCAWGTASSRLAEAGGQDTLSASAPCSQYLFLNTRR